MSTRTTARLRRRSSGARASAWLLFIALFDLVLFSMPVRADTMESTPSPITQINRQLLFVQSRSWEASRGTLEQYARNADGQWSSAGPPIPVSLGRHGMAWGRGLHEPPDHGVFKKEGDGKSPAGVFALAHAFGASDTLPADARGFPYVHALPSMYCVEDVRSEFYNRIIDARDVTARPWEKWSELRRPDGLFDWAIVVRQNAADVRRGAGSCVFLHIWRGAGVPTAGCTAMAREHVDAIVRWLEPTANPVLVQLPEPELAAWRARFDLPG